MSTDRDDATTISIVLVDDHVVVALGLKALIEDEPDLVVAEIAGPVADARTALERQRPDVVIVDFRLPDGSGIEVIENVRAVHPDAGVVMITAAADRRILAAALDAGCHGFLSKGADQSDLVVAVRAAARGESHFTPDVVRHLSHLRRFEQVDAEELSPRECEVLQLSAEGLAPEEIAERLYLSVHTVRNHIRNSMAKLHAHTKLEAVVTASRLRLISLDD